MQYPEKVNGTFPGDDFSTEDLAAAWRSDFGYSITIDATAAYFDAAEQLHIRGQLQNVGRRAIEIGRQAAHPILIAARIRNSDGEVRLGAEARAAIVPPILNSGMAASFRMTIPGVRPHDGEQHIELALIYEGRFWFCDIGFPILRVQTDGTRRLSVTSPPNPAGAPALQAPNASGADVSASSEAKETQSNTQQSAQPTLLESYLREKVSTGGVATYDDVWHCYRLLLGREADPDGFATYAAGIRQGMSVKALVGLFFASSEFAHQLSIPPSAIPKQVKLNNFDLYVPEPQTPAERDLLSTGLYKPHLSGALSSILAPGQFVLDIGAGVGEFSILAAQKVGPHGRVVALEPLAQNARLLLANCRLNDFKNIDIIPFAATDVDGYLTIIRRGAIVTSRDMIDDDLVSRIPSDVAYARTIDSIIPTERRVDVVHLSLDGFDYRAACGAKEMLRRDRPHLFGDWAPGLLNEFSTIAPQAYLQLLMECGYNRFTAITQNHGAIDLRDNVEKLEQLPSKLGTANVEFYARSVAE